MELAGQVAPKCVQCGSEIAENLRHVGGAVGARESDHRPHAPRAAPSRLARRVLWLVVVMHAHAIAAVTALFAPTGHGLSQKAVEIARPGGFPITNSMLVTWIVAACLIVCAQIATRRMRETPEGLQNMVEWLVSGLYGMLEGIIGRPLVDRTFWFFASAFIFILTANWIGLIPGVGTIGWGHHGEHGFVIEQPLLRGANADLNMTLAMALVFFGCWIWWAIQSVGIGGMASELFAPKGETTGVLRVLMFVVFFAAGCLEIVSILFRPVSLSFRLYGNIFAGETMLETMATLVPGFGWLLPIPFYFMELLVGLVQALVFTLLTAVFTLLICQHSDTHEGDAHEGDAHEAKGLTP